MAITETELHTLLRGSLTLNAASMPEEERPARIIRPHPITPKIRQNKTELFYEQHHLVPQKYAGKILAYRFEPFKLILVHGISGKVNEMSYTPDFLVVLPEWFQIVEVKPNKAAIREDAWKSLKMAIELFPWFVFVLAFVNPKAGTIEEKVLN